MSPEDKLKGMIQAAGLPVRGSYRRAEVCAILGIGDSSFWRLLNRCERDESDQLVHPDCLDSFELRSQRRVSYTELVAFMTRNNSYTRQLAVDPRQMALFGEGA